ncbi:hypothetical protein JHK85_016277 [Glycine max]|nr:hypothetical protein JHK85_016277 [Glycine max]KAG5046493.1 hypothetical protein JHK86_015899 [Glycine max]
MDNMSCNNLIHQFTAKMVLLRSHSRGHDFEVMKDDMISLFLLATHLLASSESEMAMPPSPTNIGSSKPLILVLNGSTGYIMFGSVGITQVESSFIRLPRRGPANPSSLSLARGFKGVYNANFLRLQYRDTTVSECFNMGKKERKRAREKYRPIKT